MRQVALAVEQLVDARKHLHGGAGMLAVFQQLAEPLARQQTRLHHDLVCTPPHHFGHDRVDRPQHLTASHSRVFEVGVVVEEPGDHVGAARTRGEIPSDHFARCVRTDDDRGRDSLAGPQRLEFLADAPPQHPHTAHQHDRGAPVEQDHALAHSGNPDQPRGEHEAVGRGEQQHRERGCPDEAGEITKCHTAPGHVTEADEIEDRNLRHHDTDDGGEIDVEPRRLDLEVVQREPREEIRQREEERMDDGEPHHAAVDPAQRDRRLRTRDIHGAFVPDVTAVPNPRLQVRSRRPDSGSARPPQAAARPCGQPQCPPCPAAAHSAPAPPAPVRVALRV